MISALVMRGRQGLLLLSVSEPSVIMLPVSTNTLQWLSQCSLPFQVAMEGFTVVTSIYLPGHKLLQMHFNMQKMPKCFLVPLDTLTVFTDGSGRTGQLVIIWKDTPS